MTSTSIGKTLFLAAGLALVGIFPAHAERLTLFFDENPAGGTPPSAIGGLDASGVPDTAYPEVTPGPSGKSWYSIYVKREACEIGTSDVCFYYPRGRYDKATNTWNSYCPVRGSHYFDATHVRVKIKFNQNLMVTYVGYLDDESTSTYERITGDCTSTPDLSGFEERMYPMEEREISSGASLVGLESPGCTVHCVRGICKCY